MVTWETPDVHLRDVVVRSRAPAAELGELTPRRVDPIDSVFSDEECRLIGEWRRDGGYERVLAALAADDPDLAVQ